MNSMMNRAIAHMESDPARVYTLNELRKAAGIALRSQYRLSQQLLDSGMVERASQPIDGKYAIHGYRFHQYLVDAANERRA